MPREDVIYDLDVTDADDLNVLLQNMPYNLASVPVVDSQGQTISKAKVVERFLTDGSTVTELRLS